MGPPISALEQAVLALAEQRPLLRARDLAEHGLPTMALSRLVAAARLERRDFTHAQRAPFARDVPWHWGCRAIKARSTSPYAASGHQ
ncbi:type IV toxin-antitoxin system AbiEi family antitoxin domain-containing protein [Variovorax sp. E3]|uniref:type IV toxin-antitoxin system AbiEi family antitoxin domain-containing protein n=1 Tax=Variovorax sp. E3 TaxID=1914993 RepID=UPI0035AF1389